MTVIDQHVQLVDAIAEAKQGKDLMVRCPGHDDGHASLHVTPGAGGVLLKCHANCETKAILDAVNLEWSDLFFENATGNRVDGEWTPAGPASHVYPYRDAQGNVVYEVLRIPQGRSKTFRQRRPDPNADGRYVWNLEGVERVLYRLPQVLAAVRDGQRIYVVEGEKDADNLAQLGYHATCNAQGAGKWLPQYTTALAGAEVVIIADADTVGRNHARAVREELVSAGCRVAIMEAPAPHKDVSDLLLSGGSLDDLLVSAPFEDAERAHFGVDVLDVILRPLDVVEWVVPNVMAKRERLLVTGFEGHGKSNLLRQWAVQSAAGIHWFSGALCEPRKVLVIDAENEPGQTLQSWRDLVGLAARWSDGVAMGNLIILEEWDNDELDLSNAEGTAWLHERIHAYKPDIVFMGPLTNMVGRDLRDDEPVRRLKQAVNSARSICGSAFVMEHHAPHRNPSDKARSVRPYGSSMFLKWPDYGYGLLPDADEPGRYSWERTRWPRVRSRAWPDALRWGDLLRGEWPWCEAEPQ